MIQRTQSVKNTFSKSNLNCWRPYTECFNRKESPFCWSKKNVRNFFKNTISNLILLVDYIWICELNTAIQEFLCYWEIQLTVQMLDVLVKKLSRIGLEDFNREAIEWYNKIKENPIPIWIDCRSIQTEEPSINIK